jgi:hypothetical protein
LPGALERLAGGPDLVITDASVFKIVNDILPSETPLTAFSVLLAAAKGDIRTFVEGAQAIARLTPNSRVLIAEACTHVPDTEDIGRVKIPALIRKRVDLQRNEADGISASELFFSERNEADGISASELFLSERAEIPERNEAPDGLHIDISAGNDFPEDLSSYDLIIHCGACVASRQLVRARTRKALLAGVPITNYGIALAQLQGMLDRIAIPGLQTRPQSCGCRPDSDGRTPSPQS